MGTFFLCRARLARGQRAAADWTPGRRSGSEPGAPYAHLHFTPTAAGRQAYLFDSDELPSEFDTSFINDQAYDVTLELLLPVTSANVDLGNFMTTLELYNANGSIVWRASRPVRIAYLLERFPPH